MTQPKRTLVVHTGGIGDFLLACPSIERLGREGRVELLGRKERLELAVAGGIAGAAHDFESVGFDSVFDGPTQKLRKFLRSFHRVVVWMADKDGGIRRGLEDCNVEKIDIRAGLPPEGWIRHASAYYLDRLGMPDGPELRLAIAPGPEQYDIVIHPGSGSAGKNWPLENYLALANELESAGREIAWCLGPAELERGRGEFSRIPRDARRIETDSLVGVATHLAAARQFIGNDSGVTHLAVAVGCPTIALFGPTNPAVWAPRGCRVLKFEEARSALLDEILKNSRTRL